MSAADTDASSNADAQGPQFDVYQLLRQCSEKGEEGINEWNRWRSENVDVKISLQRADLSRAYLRRANLKKADLYRANLEGAMLHFADLEGATLLGADLRNSQLFAANLKHAKVGTGEAVELTSAQVLKRLYIVGWGVKGLLLPTDLSGAQLLNADLCGACLSRARLLGTDCRWAAVDAHTVLIGCEVDRCTDFSGTAFGRVLIDPATKQLLEYNERRRNWWEWYKKHTRLKWVVRTFWWLSDYGLSTGRIVTTFFVLASVFALLYYFAAMAAPPGVVNSLLEGKEGVVPGWLVPIRAIYFSVVTMTTLGFGDMHANCQSFWGHVLLTLQVLLGYVLLGALVTRFAVLFTAGGPAGRFAEAEPEGPGKRAKSEKGEAGT